MNVIKVAYSRTIKSDSFWIDGKESPRLTLKVGVTYTFEVNAPGNPLYITTDELGGHEIDVDGIEGVENNGTDVGVVKFTPKESDRNRKLYYQSTKNRNIGYKIIVQ
jgi:hypothetical protein